MSLVWEFSRLACSVTAKHLKGVFKLVYFFPSYVGKDEINQVYTYFFCLVQLRRHGPNTAKLGPNNVRLVAVLVHRRCRCRLFVWFQAPYLQDQYHLGLQSKQKLIFNFRQKGTKASRKASPLLFQLTTRNRFHIIKM